MKNRKKILFLSNRSPLPIKDGHTRRTYHILKGLAEKHNVHFVSLYETPEELEFNNRNQLENLCEKVEFYPAPPKKICYGMIIRLIRSLFSSDPYTIWRHYSLPYLKRIRELISIGDYDIIHCDNLPIAYTVRHENRVYKTITDHDVSYLKCLRMSKETNNILLKLFMLVESFKLKKLEKTVFKQYDMGIVVSNEDKRKIQNICIENCIAVVENGVDVNEFVPLTYNNNKKNIIWVGGFNNYSNENAVKYFIQKIWPLIKLQLPDIKFELVGGGITESLNKIISSDPSIHLIGYVENPLPYIQNAKVFVVPILSGSGTRLKLLEAMACGTAAVTTEVGCEGIEGADGEHFVIARTPEDFSSAVVNLIIDSNYRKNLEINARSLIEEKYNWSFITDKLNLKYSQIGKSR